MPRASSLAPLVGALLMVCVVRSANAETQLRVPAGGGLPSFDVTVDLKGAIVVVSSPVPGAPARESTRVPIGLDASEMPDGDGVQVEAVSLGHDRHIAHLRVGVRGAHDGSAWEALLAGGPEGRAPIFAGRTGFIEGDPGERTGTAVQITKGATSSFALVGSLREDLRVCGQERTLLDPRAVYPDSLDLRPATVQRISEDERTGAVAIAAEDKGSALDKPLGTLLVARGSSVASSTGRELTDGDTATWWHEGRPGVGQGEFVTMAAASGVPMTRAAVVLPPALTGAAAPKSFYLTTETQVFQVTLPDDAAGKPGEVYEVAFPEPVATSCMSLVLDGAFARAATHPDVGLAEIVGYSEFDAPGATLADVAKHLSGPRGEAAAQVLERTPGGLEAVSSTYDALDARGRARAIDVAASTDQCEDAAPLLVRAFCANGGAENDDLASEATRKAREKLERCAGAAPAVADRLRSDAASRACLAPLLATLAPEYALAPLADAIAATSAADTKTRSALRAAFGVALAGAPAGAFAAIAGDAKRSAAARLEMLRAAERRVTEVRAEADAILGELLRGTGGAPEMRLRYLALGPLGHLARAGDASALSLVLSMMGHDSEWPVRVRAIEAAAGLATAEPAVILAARDPEPRVREAALTALAMAPSAAATRAASAALGHEDWTFVKVPAIAVLMNAPASAESVAALGAALEDAAPRVRGAAIVGLARAGAAGASWRPAIRKMLDDNDEDAEVRSAAASALGAMCDREAAGRLTELARPLAGVAADEDAREVGLGAVVGLAALHPPDLKERLAPLLAPSAPPAVQAAATHALAARTHCP